MSSVLRHLRRVALLPRGDGPSDADLLQSFLSRRDEAAFEALLRRHGPMVLGVCRRVLGNRHDAEDAFQATFLVLVRKGTTIRPRELVGNWLWGVAYRTALKARAMNTKRRTKEREAQVAPRLSLPLNGALDEMLDRLDEALGRLPEKYRAPLVLCELEGRSRKEVARKLDVPEGTLSWRLAQAKKMLARKLSCHGPVLSAGAVAAVLSQGAAPAALPAPLLKSTAKAGLQLAAGQALVGSAPPEVVSLTEGVLKAMLLTKLKVASWAFGVVLLAGAGAVGLSYQRAAAQPAPQPRPAYEVAQGRNVTPALKVGRPAADDLESLRLEIEALRRELRATKETVRELQAEVRGKKEVGTRLDRDEKELRRLDSLKLEGEKRKRLEMLQLEADNRRLLDLRKLEAEKLHRLDAARREEAAAKALLGEKAAADPLAELEDAVKRLRKNPKDKQAAEALDRALRRLKERKVPDGDTVREGRLKKS
jgi:RNA polymerase sigma factor (sigma-70 family)